MASSQGSAFSPSDRPARSSRASGVWGRSWRNDSIRSGSYLALPGSCQQYGPSFDPRASTPEAKKLASGISTSFSRLMWVTNWWPFTEKTKVSGVAAAQFWKLVTFWCE